MGLKSKKKKREFDEFYLLRLDSSGRPRGARFAKVRDKVASAAIDMKCFVLIQPSATVSRLGMELPVGRLYGQKLVMPRIRRNLHAKIIEMATISAKREKVRMEAARTKESTFIRQLIMQADAASAMPGEKRPRDK